MRSIIYAVLAVSLMAAVPLHAADAATAKDVALKALVRQTVRPLMKRYGIAGMAVGLTVNGRHAVFNFGLASKAMRRPVDGKTLFEIGSVTKTFTASLVSYARLTGRLSLTDTVSADFPSLRGTSFDRIRLINLGTYTAGGLPLQFPGDVMTDDEAIDYYKRWKPSRAPGSYRLYSNPSIMLLGLIAAKRIGADFGSSMQREIFAPLGLSHTFLVVPNDQLSHYAQGYTEMDQPKRMSPGPLAAEAYGIRTTADDMLRFVDANMGSPRLDDVLRRAIVETHVRYYRIGVMTQDLVWEEFANPASLPDLLHGSSNRLLFEENRASEFVPPLRPGRDVLIDKTGSTNGFGAYVAFVPRRKTGIVLLANKSYAISARVRAAYQILTRLKEMR